MEWILFLIIWFAFVWITVTDVEPQQNPLHVPVQSPIFQQDCSVKKIPCVDDCSFLCDDQRTRCVGGICETQPKDPVECNTSRGGMLIMANTPVPHWSCLCTDSAYWSGSDCNTLNSDVCEQGAFMYIERDNFLCICPYPYEKVLLNGKPHCLEKRMANFFPEQIDTSLVRREIGPSER